MNTPLLAASTVSIAAPVSRVWAGLTDANTIMRYMHGMEPVSTWRQGDTLVWIGQPGEPEANHATGTIVRLEPEHTLQYTFFWPGGGLPNTLENHHTITYTLTPIDAQTTQLEVTQGDFTVSLDPESSRTHSQSFWGGALQKLKELLESGAANEGV